MHCINYLYGVLDSTTKPKPKMWENLNSTADSVSVMPCSVKVYVQILNICKTYPWMMLTQHPSETNSNENG
jgi:hypothetical protein